MRFGSFSVGARPIGSEIDVAMKSPCKTHPLIEELCLPSSQHVVVISARSLGRHGEGWWRREMHSNRSNDLLLYNAGNRHFGSHY